MQARHATVLIGSLALYACGLCGNDTKYEVPSPDGKLVATIYWRDCGATTDFYTFVSVHVPKGEIRAKDDVFEQAGGHDMGLVWKDNEHLEIRRPIYTTSVPEKDFKII